MLSIPSRFRPQGLVPNATSHSVSIGLVTFNEGALVTSILHRLFAQNSAITELIVCDNGSDDSTMDILLNLQRQAPFPMTILKSSQNNIGLARKKIVEKAKGDLIAFLDPDCQPDSTWLRQLLMQWTAGQKQFERLAGVAGPNRLPEDQNTKVLLNTLLLSPLGHGYSPQAWQPTSAVAADHLPTTNCLLVRQYVLDVGNFSSERRSVGEDVELGRRLRAQSFRLLLAPKPVMLNNSVHSSGEWLNRMARFGQAQRELQGQCPSLHHGPSIAARLLVPLLMVSMVMGFLAPKFIGLLALYPLAVAGECTRVLLMRRQLNVRAFFLLVRLMVGTHCAYFWGWLNPNKTFAPMSWRIWRWGQVAPRA